MTDTKPDDIITFWKSAGPKKWFAKDDAFDAAIGENFEHFIRPAANGDFDNWTTDATGSLALILVLDQFPRNLYRDDAKAFTQDAKALSIAKHAIKQGHDKELDSDLVAFIYMPFMHSENLQDQQTCLSLMSATGKEGNVKFARIHLDIIQKFGRFPHRNAVLGRNTTAEEQAFLDGGGFKG